MSAPVSRRNLAGASAALLLLAPAAAGAAKAAELDRDLLDACAAFAEAERQVKIGEAMPSAILETQEGWERYIDAPNRVWCDDVRRLIACPAPRTPEGVQAKALAALTAVRRFCNSIVPDEVTLAQSALEDVGAALDLLAREADQVSKELEEHANGMRHG